VITSLQSQLIFKITVRTKTHLPTRNISKNTSYLVSLQCTFSGIDRHYKTIHGFTASFRNYHQQPEDGSISSSSSIGPKHAV